MSALLLALVLTATPERVVVTPFTVSGVAPELSQVLEDALAASLRKRGLEVVSRQDITTLLSTERQRTLLGCEAGEGSCLAELVNALGCELSVVTSLARLDGGFRGTARLISSKNAKVQAEVVLSARSEAALVDALDDAGAQLARSLGGAASPPPRWVPAAVGGVLLAGAAVGFVFAGLRFEAMKTAAGYPETQRLANEGSTFQALAWTGVGLGVVGIAWTTVWMVLGQTPPAVTVSLDPGRAGLVLSGSFR